MGARLGNFEAPPVAPQSVEGVQELAHRLGGFSQQDRMIRDKYRTLLRALRASYQGAWIKKYYPDYIETMDGERDKKPSRALINPNRLTLDYDDKILSIPFEEGIRIGDIFEWVNTGTYWLVEMQDLEELAYFKGDIRKCTYEIKWVDEGKKYSTYAAVRGPNETRINNSSAHSISIDKPNYTLYIRMPANEYTLKQFKRYSKFILQDVCWRVEAVDAISVPGLLELTAVEYYINEDTDDVKNGIVDGLVVEPIVTDTNSDIVGEIFIKPKKTYEYQYTGTKKGEWEVDKKGIQLQADDKKVKLKWESNFSGSFELRYGDCAKTIIVESLF